MGWGCAAVESQSGVVSLQQQQQQQQQKQQQHLCLHLLQQGLLPQRWCLYHSSPLVLMCVVGLLQQAFSQDVV
jgi:hypothetical protein